MIHNTYICSFLVSSDLSDTFRTISHVDLSQSSPEICHEKELCLHRLEHIVFKITITFCSQHKWICLEQSVGCIHAITFKRLLEPNISGLMVFNCKSPALHWCGMGSAREVLFVHARKLSIWLTERQWFYFAARSCLKQCTLEGTQGLHPPVTAGRVAW